VPGTHPGPRHDPVESRSRRYSPDGRRRSDRLWRGVFSPCQSPGDPRIPSSRHLPDPEARSPPGSFAAPVEPAHGKETLMDAHIIRLESPCRSGSSRQAMCSGVAFAPAMNGLAQERRSALLASRRVPGVRAAPSFSQAIHGRVSAGQSRSDRTSWSPSVRVGHHRLIALPGDGRCRDRAPQADAPTIGTLPDRPVPHVTARPGDAA